MISWKTIRAPAPSASAPRAGARRSPRPRGPRPSRAGARRRPSAASSRSLTFAFLSGVDDVERLEVVLDVDAEPCPRLLLVLLRDLGRAVRAGRGCGRCSTRRRSRCRGSPRWSSPSRALDDHEFLRHGAGHVSGPLAILLAVAPRPSPHVPRGRGTQLAAPARALPAPRRAGASTCPRGRLRARREPQLELRPVAARDAALPAALPALHGQVGALLDAVQAVRDRRGRVPGAPRAGRPRGDRDGDRSSAARGTSSSCSRRARGARRGCGRSTRRGRTRGAARIALDADVPLVPAAIVGTDRLGRLAQLRVAYGPPIPLDDLAGREDARPGRDRAADGGDRRARTLAREAAPDRRRRLVRAPLLPRAAEVDPAHGRRRRRPARRRRQPARPALGGGAAARGARRLGHADRADLPARGARRLPDRARVRRRSCSSSSTWRRSSSSRSASRPRRRTATRRTTSSPPAVAFEEARGGTRARRERRPRHVPARERADDDPAAAEGRRAAGADRARPRCASATASSRSRCPTSSRCAATPPTRSPARAASAPKTAADAAGAVRQPRGGARRGPVRGRGGGAAALPAHRDDGRGRAAAAARRPGADLGSRGRSSRDEWGLGRLAGRLEALSSS